MPQKIFINYRRDNSIATAGRLHDRLLKAFGRTRLFMDVDNIPAGVDFVEYLSDQVAACDVFLAVIDPQWISAKDHQGRRRLDNPDDFVAIEIAAALARDIRVIPVLIDGARLPGSEELPETLRPLLRRNALELRNTQFGRDADVLVDKIRDALKVTKVASRRWLVFAAAAGAALLLAVGVGYFAASWRHGPAIFDTASVDDAQRKADERRRAEEDAKKQADAEAEARRKAAEEEAKQAEEAKRKTAEEAAKRTAAEDEARRIADERAKADVEARRDQALMVTPGSGRSFRDRSTDGAPCAICPEMVVLPAGDFMMGSPASEPGRNDNEGPQRRVTLARPFAVGKLSASRGEFAAFIAESGHKVEGGCEVLGTSGWTLRSDRTWLSPGFEQDDGHPAVCVSFEDATAYVKWLSAKVGKPYRLLSEAEWEYAARAGASGLFYFIGDEKDFCRYGNGADLSAKKANASWDVLPCDDGHVFTATSGTFGANGFGLNDMLGNVRQWVEDCAFPNYRGAPTDGTARLAADCKLRVNRGGAWASGANELRIAFRTWSAPGRRTDFLGFRVARTIGP